MVVAAIAVAAFLIIKNWSKVKVFGERKDWFSNAFEKAKDIVEKFKEKFEQVKRAVQPITSALSEDFKRCVDAVKPVLEKFSELFQAVFESGTAEV